MKCQNPGLRARITCQTIENPLPSQQINPTHPLPFIYWRQMGSISATLLECWDATVVDLCCQHPLFFFREPMVVRVENLLKDVDAPNTVWASNPDREGCLHHWAGDVHLGKDAVWRRWQFAICFRQILEVSIHVCFYSRQIISRVEPDVKVYKRIALSTGASASGKGPAQGYRFLFLNN
jgi:hypothetical protein